MDRDEMIKKSTHSTVPDLKVGVCSGLILSGTCIIPTLKGRVCVPSNVSKIKEQKTNTRDFINLKSIIFNSRAGFTLIEVLIALTILSVGLLGVALMQVTSISGTTFSREMNVATGLAQDMLEKLRTLTYTDTTTDPALTAGATHPVAADVNRDLDGDTLPPFLAVGAGTANVIDERGLTLGPTLYTRTWDVNNNTPASDMKTIAVTVRWQERGGPTGTTTRSVTITGVKVRS